MARLARVDQVEPGGLALQANGSRYWLPWPLLGLSDVQTTSSSATLRWRIHCIDPESRPGDYHSGRQNSMLLRGDRGHGVMPESVQLRTGVMELECHFEPGAM